ncbi:uncharacterized protein LOC112099958 [Citrus clementina]|uniref:uncharacterized protein LOC112099958 n=1 Tax=Citrus clementina TaxID=85681 RepID=UPI000CED09DE|nr:uncharacterized protein LOC112099958 [Citrus x clementina]
MDAHDVDVDVEDKADWSTRTETVFIRIVHDHVKKGRAPRGPQELFNYRHSSLRNVIERCFGVLKARFSILRDMHNYSLRKQRLIPIACCALHNFIRRENASDRLFGDFDVQDLVTNDERDTSRPLTNIDLSPASVAEMNATRDGIAAFMWHDYIRNA